MNYNANEFWNATELWNKEGNFTGSADKAKKVQAILGDEILYLEKELRELKARKEKLKDFIEQSK